MQMPLAPGTPSDEEVIPTAIVIKNIPFTVKRETLLDIIVRARFISEGETSNPSMTPR